MTMMRMGCECARLKREIQVEVVGEYLSLLSQMHGQYLAGAVMPKFTGSIDTSDKLARLRAYLQAYSIALKDQGFERIYIDAFAGSGSRTETRAALPLLGPELAQPQEVDTPGSARIALSVDPPFQAYAFIEKDRGRYAELEKLKEQHPELKIALKQGDANKYVRQLCERVPWNTRQAGIKGMRGVVFLDPTPHSGLRVWHALVVRQAHHEGY
jgi:three-Cys-motif partner protein